MDDFSSRLKFAMNKKGIKPIELARITNLNKGIISKYMNNRYKPKQDRLHQIAIALGVNEGWLLGYDMPMESNEELDNIIINKIKELSDDKKQVVITVIDSMKE